MKQYYEKQPKQEIIGFYCFIADKPPEKASQPKRKKKVLDLQSFVHSLMSPHRSSSKSHSWI